MDNFRRLLGGNINGVFRSWLHDVVLLLFLETNEFLIHTSSIFLLLVDACILLLLFMVSTEESRTMMSC